MENTAQIPKIDTRQPIELAEGVVIHLVIAGPFPRAAAFLLDLFFRGLIFFAVALVLIFTMGENTWGSNGGLFLLLLFGISWFYHIIFEGGRRGATWGKRIVGLRVVQLSGARITWGQAFTRNLMRFIDIMPSYYTSGSYAVGLLSIFLTKRCQRLGDLVANTLVVYDEKKRRPGGQLSDLSVSASQLAPEMPPYPLRREEERAIVEFAERLPLWSPERQVELANTLQPITGLTGPPAVDRLVAYARWIQQIK